MDKLKSLGIPSGPLYGRLKRGEEIVTSTGIVVCKVTSPLAHVTQCLGNILFVLIMYRSSTCHHGQPTLY